MKKITQARHMEFTEMRQKDGFNPTKSPTPCCTVGLVQSTLTVHSYSVKKPTASRSLEIPPVCHWGYIGFSQVSDVNQCCDQEIKRSYFLFWNIRTSVFALSQSLDYSQRLQRYSCWHLQLFLTRSTMSAVHTPSRSEGITSESHLSSSWVRCSSLHVVSDVDAGTDT